jgi:hypothetical protein
MSLQKGFVDFLQSCHSIAVAVAESNVPAKVLIPNPNNLGRVEPLLGFA